MKYSLYFRTLRTIDANLDRLSEGLRVIEDISRFILQNTSTTETLKQLRHEFTITDVSIRNDLLSSRDSIGDIGRESPVAGIERNHLIDLVTSNSKRAQESLRVLEEFAKLPEVPSDIAERDFEQARFALYEVERELTLLLTRQNKLERIDGLYVIIDSQALTGVSVVDAANQIIAGGASIIQLRSKILRTKDLLSLAKTMRNICTQAGILFIINDSVEIALAADADGVHLGNSDLPVYEVRQILPPDRLIGCTVRTVKQALQAQDEGADYIGVGSIYASTTKPDAEVIGVERLRAIREAVSLPIVAIGGIHEDNVYETREHGADSIAVISAISNSEDIESASKRLVSAFRKRGNI